MQRTKKLLPQIVAAAFERSASVYKFPKVGLTSYEQWESGRYGVDLFSFFAKEFRVSSVSYYRR